MFKHLDNLIRLVAEFILLEKNYDDLIWFEGKKEEISQIFQENEELLLKNEFKIDKLS